MRAYIDAWLTQLEHADPFWGLPLIVVGLVLLFTGWHFQKTAVPLIFALIGLLIGTVVVGGFWSGLAVGAALGVLLAVVCVFTTRFSVTILGGLCGASVLAGYLAIFEELALPPVARWGVAAFGFLAGSATVYIFFREMVMILTAFVGTLFLICGLNTTLPQVAAPLHATVTQFLADYPALLVPFLVGSPTLIGTLVQMSNASRNEAGTA